VTEARPSDRMCVELPGGGWTDKRRRWRIAQLGEHLSDEEEAAGSSPAPPIHVTVAQPVERSLETRGVAGSTPAGHMNKAP
jgi:hypothetical protein